MIIENDSIGVKYVKNFYSDLEEELNESEEVIVDFSSVKRIDLSVVQAIIVIGREAREKGKIVKLKSVSDDVKKQMQICGLKT